MFFIHRIALNARSHAQSARAISPREIRRVRLCKEVRGSLASSWALLSDACSLRRAEQSNSPRCARPSDPLDVCEPLTSSCTQSHASYDPAHTHIFQHDLTKPLDDLYAKLDDAPPEFGRAVRQFDIVSCVFVLSALAPRLQAQALETLLAVCCDLLTQPVPELTLLRRSSSRPAVRSSSETMPSTMPPSSASTRSPQPLTPRIRPSSRRRPTLPRRLRTNRPQRPSTTPIARFTDEAITPSPISSPRRRSSRMSTRQLVCSGSRSRASARWSNARWRTGRSSGAARDGLYMRTGVE